MYDFKNWLLKRRSNSINEDLQSNANQPLDVNRITQAPTIDSFESKAKQKVNMILNQAKTATREVLKELDNQVDTYARTPKPVNKPGAVEQQYEMVKEYEKMQQEFLNMTVSLTDRVLPYVLNRIGKYLECINYYDNYFVENYKKYQEKNYGKVVDRKQFARHKTYVLDSQDDDSPLNYIISLYRDEEADEIKELWKVALQNLLEILSAFTTRNNDQKRSLRGLAIPLDYDVSDFEQFYHDAIGKRTGGMNYFDMMDNNKVEKGINKIVAIAKECEKEMAEMVQNTNLTIPAKNVPVEKLYPGLFK